MKIGIHHSKGSFSERWIEYCKQNNIPFKVLNCYDTDIIEQLVDCDALMWHHHQTTYKDVLSAKNILFSLEHAGVNVFPDFKTNWHFDDKIAQMYLLQAINAPLVPSYVFYDRKTAMKWLNETSFPKVFKLKGGSGSGNVKLASNKKEATKLINIAFGRGFSQYDKVGNLKDRYRKYKLGKASLIGLLKGIGRLFIPTLYSKMVGREKGYAYFQDFIPDNNFDIRVIIVGKHSFAIRRGVRKGDFRASGSGDIHYNHKDINLDTIKISFEVNKHIQAQSIAFDYVLYNNKPLIVEISYGYAVEAYDPCPGYWDKNLKWHEGKFNPQAWMIEDLINTIK